MSKLLSVFPGEIWTARMSLENVGSEQEGTRPVIIMSSSPKNWDSVVVVPVTQSGRGVRFQNTVLSDQSCAAYYQITTISKQRLGRRIDKLSCYDMIKVVQKTCEYIGGSNERHR